MKTFTQDICENIFDESLFSKNQDYRKHVESQYLENCSEKGSDYEYSEDELASIKSYHSPDLFFRNKRMELSSSIKVAIGLQNSKKRKIPKRTLTKNSMKNFVKYTDQKHSSRSLKIRGS